MQRRGVGWIAGLLILGSPFAALISIPVAVLVAFTGAALGWYSLG